LTKKKTSDKDATSPSSLKKAGKGSPHQPTTPHQPQSANLLKLNPIQTEMTMTFTPSSANDSTNQRQPSPSKFEQSGQKLRH